MIKLSPFARKVYKVVSEIPIGQVRSYKWVAARCGSPKAYRAVGQLMKANPWPIIVPCHRVVKSDCSLGGYRYGEKRKAALLKIESELVECIESKK